MKRSRKGFNLLELIVVIAIILILVLTGMPKLLGFVKNAKVATQAQNARLLESASMVYYTENDGAYPVGADFTITGIADDGLGEILAKEFEARTGGAPADVVALGTFKELDTALASEVTGIDLADYVIADSGVFAGQVFKKVPQENKSGVEYSGSVGHDVK